MQTATARVREAADTKRAQVHASTRIQAQWRGYRTRSQVLSQSSAATLDGDAGVTDDAGSGRGSPSGKQQHSSDEGGSLDADDSGYAADVSPRDHTRRGQAGDAAPHASAATPNHHVAVAAAHMSPVAMKLRVVAESYRDGLISQQQYAAIKDSILRAGASSPGQAAVVAHADDVARGSLWGSHGDDARSRVDHDGSDARRPELAASSGSRLFTDAAPYPTPTPVLTPTPTLAGHQRSLPAVGGATSRSHGARGHGTGPRQGRKLKKKRAGRSKKAATPKAATPKARQRAKPTSRPSTATSRGGGTNHGAGGGDSANSGGTARKMVRSSSARGSSAPNGSSLGCSASSKVVTSLAATGSSQPRGSSAPSSSSTSGHRLRPRSGSRPVRPPTAGSSRASVASGKSNSSRPAVPPCVQHVIEKGGKPLYDAVRTWRRHTAAPPRVCVHGCRVVGACCKRCADVGRARVQDWLFNFDVRMDALSSEFHRQVEGRSSVAAVTAAATKKKHHSSSRFGASRPKRDQRK